MMFKREPKRPPPMEIEVAGQPLRIYFSHLESMETDDRGWPTINGQPVTSADLNRGWMVVS